ncbi:MAG: TOBE domain-containing protein [Nitrospirae bacterium]|nr:TOBE domain-containing protein [Nitrospirota bacterium]
MNRHGERKVLHSINEKTSHSRIVSSSSNSFYLDTIQLNRLEQTFRKWTDCTERLDIKLSRKRIFIIFLLIRYAGAKLNETLAIDISRDIDFKQKLVIFGRKRKKNGSVREVQIPQQIISEIRAAINDPLYKKHIGSSLKVDPGHVRRKFYECAKYAGILPSAGTPEIIRRSRAIELIQGNMPLPVVQRLLGHSTPNITASYVTFSEEEMKKVARYFAEKESNRKTSARNSFFGKISSITRGDIQSQIELQNISGDIITTVITNNSLEKLGLKKGSLITAEVKAPWVILEKSKTPPVTTAENILKGSIAYINKGKITTEYVIRMPDGTELCSVVSTKNANLTGLKENDQVWAIFNSFAVVLHTD